MHNVIKYCLYAAAGYGLLVLLVFLLQRRMIYFPDPERPSVETVKSVGLRFWPDGATNYKGFISARASGHFQGTVIAFHGNAGSAWHRDYFVNALEPLGYRVVLAEYPAYGGRPGAPGETVFVQDAVETIRQVLAAFQTPVYLLGESMGCAVAAAAAAHPDISTAGLILITPWDSLPDLAQSLYWYLPARLLTRDRFDSVYNLRAYRHPVAVAVAMEDEVVPNKHSMRLYDALKTAKKLWRFEGSGHNNWPTHPGAPWWREAMEFVATGETAAPRLPEY